MNKHMYTINSKHTDYQVIFFNKHENLDHKKKKKDRKPSFDLRRNVRKELSKQGGDFVTISRSNSQESKIKEKSSQLVESLTEFNTNTLLTCFVYAIFKFKEDFFSCQCEIFDESEQRKYLLSFTSQNGAFSKNNEGLASMYRKGNEFYGKYFNHHIKGRTFVFEYPEDMVTDILNNLKTIAKNIIYNKTTREKVRRLISPQYIYNKLTDMTFMKLSLDQYSYNEEDQNENIIDEDIAIGFNNVFQKNSTDDHNNQFHESHLKKKVIDLITKSGSLSRFEIVLEDNNTHSGSIESSIPGISSLEKKLSILILSLVKLDSLSSLSIDLKGLVENYPSFNNEFFFVNLQFMNSLTKLKLRNFLFSVAEENIFSRYIGTSSLAELAIEDFDLCLEKVTPEFLKKDSTMNDKHAINIPSKFSDISSLVVIAKKRKDKQYLKTLENCFQETLFNNIKQVSTLRSIRLKLKNKKSMAELYSKQEIADPQYGNLNEIVKINNLGEFSIENFDIPVLNLIDLFAEVNKANSNSVKLTKVDIVNSNVDILVNTLQDEFYSMENNNINSIGSIGKRLLNNLHLSHGVDLEMKYVSNINFSNHNFSRLKSISFILENISQKTEGKATSSNYGVESDFTVELFTTTKHSNLDSMISIDFTNCCLSDSCLSPLIDLIKKNKISGLVLAKNTSISSLGLKVLLLAISKNTSLKSFDISYINASFVAKELKDTFSSHKGMEDLNISYCGIESFNIKHIADIFKIDNYSHIRNLTFDGNKFNKGFCKEEDLKQFKFFALSMKFSLKLKRLSLKNCGIRPDFPVMFILESKSLKEVCFSDINLHINIDKISPNIVSLKIDSDIDVNTLMKEKEGSEIKKTEQFYTDVLMNQDEEVSQQTKIKVFEVSNVKSTVNEFLCNGVYGSAHSSFKVDYSAQKLHSKNILCNQSVDSNKPNDIASINSVDKSLKKISSLKLNINLDDESLERTKGILNSFIDRTNNHSLLRNTANFDLSKVSLDKSQNSDSIQTSIYDGLSKLKVLIIREVVDDKNTQKTLFKIISGIPQTQRILVCLPIIMLDKRDSLELLFSCSSKNSNNSKKENNKSLVFFAEFTKSGLDQPFDEMFNSSSCSIPQKQQQIILSACIQYLNQSKISVFTYFKTIQIVFCTAKYSLVKNNISQLYSFEEQSESSNQSSYLNSLLYKEKNRSKDCRVVYFKKEKDNYEEVINSIYSDQERKKKKRLLENNKEVKEVGTLKHNLSYGNNSAKDFGPIIEQPVNLEHEEGTFEDKDITKNVNYYRNIVNLKNYFKNNDITPPPVKDRNDSIDLVFKDTHCLGTKLFKGFSSIEIKQNNNNTKQSGPLTNIFSMDKNQDQNQTVKAPKTCKPNFHSIEFDSVFIIRNLQNLKYLTIENNSPITKLTIKNVNLNSEELKLFEDAINKIETLKELCLINTHIAGAESNILFKLLSNQYTKLDFSGNYLNGYFTANLMKYLVENSEAKCLTLNNCYIHYLELILEELRNTKVQVFEVSNFFFGDTVIEAFSDNSQCKTLTDGFMNKSILKEAEDNEDLRTSIVKDIVNSSIINCEEEMSMKTESLKDSKKLKTVKFGFKKIPFILPFLINPDTEQLEFTSYDFSFNQYLLKDFLNVNVNVSSLVFRSCHPENLIIKIICSSLKSTNNITKLDLSYTPINLSGAYYLKKYLTEDSNLKQLILNDCNIVDDVFIYFFEVMRKNTVMSNLSLENNYMTYRCSLLFCVNLIESLSMLPTNSSSEEIQMPSSSALEELNFVNAFKGVESIEEVEDFETRISKMLLSERLINKENQ
eukprot:CAMPEP_0170538768 /NCGR_PEP_ID=MMETSP0209-20121228/103513_1 /TAXON_ID=665100 ORGANISM="Litonotus pictus, Strain P1" /NCGR_SAMPLE_ID=MMETSP0209 /ASSEMBLY_ACC=CAM_ASM_000301 /LENGTH=1801 /DNA_ID=CAMNT_0010840533 /DNA_START=176 /DNA_END=5578 /DNA_ORIENTATION=-